MIKCYEFKRIESIQGKQASFYYLLIDGKNKFEKFYDKHKNDFEDEFDYIQSLMQLLSEGQLLPKTKFRPIKGKKCKSIYELKKGKIRVYCIKVDPNFYIPFAGFKDDEKTDYDTLATTAKDFLESGERPNVTNTI